MSVAPTLGAFTISNQTITPSTVFPYTITITNPTSNSSGTFTYVFNTSYSGYSISGNTITILSLPASSSSSITINGTQAAASGYTVKNFNTTFTVSKQIAYIPSFVITLPITENNTNYILPNQTLTITDPSSTGDGAYSYTTSTPTIVEVNGNVLSFLQNGTASVLCTQANGVNYFGTTKNSNSFEVRLNTIIISSINLPLFYVALDSDLTLPQISSESGVLVSNPSYTWSTTTPLLIDISGDTVTPKHTGTGSITLTIANGSTYFGSSRTQTFTIGKGTQNEYNTLETEYYYSPDAVYTITNPTDSSSTGAFSYTTTDPYVTITGNTFTVQVEGLGRYFTVDVTQEETDDFEAAYTSYQFYVNKIPSPPITFSIDGQSYGPFTGGETVTLTNIPLNSSKTIVPIPNANIEGTYVLDIMNSINHTVENLTANFNETGLGVFNFYQLSSSLYDGFNPPIIINITVTDNENVTNNTPTIEIDLPNINFNGTKTFPLNPTSPSSGAFTYTTTTPNFVSFDGDTFTLKTANNVTVNITVTQAATENYLSNSISSNFQVFIGAAPSINVSLNGSLAGSFPNNAVIPFPEQPCGLVVHVTLSSLNIDGAYSVTSTTPSLVSISGTTLTLEAIGSASVTITQAKGFFYESSTIRFNFSIVRGLPAITFAVPNRTYAPLTTFTLPAATSLSTGAFTYSTNTPDVITVTGTTVTVLKAGIANVVASLASDVNYFSNTDQTYFTIFKATPVVSNFSNVVVEYQPNLVLTIPAISSNTETPIIFTASTTDVLSTFTGNQTTVLKNGECIVRASQIETTNYLPVPSYDLGNSILVTVVKARPTLGNLVLPTDKKVGDDNFELINPTSTDTVTGFNFSSSNPLVATINGTTVTIVGVGSTIITAVQGTSSKPNELPSTSAVLNILPQSGYTGSLYIPAKYYGDDPFQLIVPDHVNNVDPVSYSSSDSTVATVSLTGLVTIHNAGSSVITVSQPENANYSPTLFSSYTLEVFKQNVVAGLTDIGPKTYLDEPFFLSPFSTHETNDSWTFSNSDTAVATIATVVVDSVVKYQVTILKPGSTDIQATQAADDNHNSSLSNIVTLQVARAVPTITLTTLSTSYVPNGTVTLMATSNNDASNIIFQPLLDSNVLFLGGDYDTVLPPPFTSGIMADILNVGTTEITLYQEPSEYFVSFTRTVSFTVNKADPDLAFAVDTTVYEYIVDGLIQLNATSTNSTGLITYSSNNSVLTVNQNKAVIQGAGTGSISATIAATNNYTAKTVSTTFTVVNDFFSLGEKTLPDLQNFQVTGKTYGSNPFTITPPTTNNDESDIVYSSSNLNVATISGSTVTIVGAGSTTITASQPITTNFLAEFITANFIVYKATPTFSSNWTIPTKQVGASPFLITGLTSLNTVTPITYASSNANVATVSGTTITVVGAGSTTITASQVSNANFNSATPVTTIFTVTDPTAPVSNICFLAGTPILTDQGVVHIESIDPERHTIRKKRIVGVTQTWSPNAWLVEFEPHALGENKPSACTVMSMYHKVEHQGVMVSAAELLNHTTIKKVPYHRETLYNVLQDDHGTMIVHGLVCETLHPDNITAKLFRLLNALPWEEKVKHVSNFNAFCETHKIYAC